MQYAHAEHWLYYALAHIYIELNCNVPRTMANKYIYIRIWMRENIDPFVRIVCRACKVNALDGSVVGMLPLRADALLAAAAAVRMVHGNKRR